MCGRYALFDPDARLAPLFDLDHPTQITPRYNIAPSQTVPIVRVVDDRRRLDLARWGLIPSWAKDTKIGYRTINARGETVFEKPAFRSAARKRRCLMPASGFYEWRKDGPEKTAKTPHWIHLKNGSPFAFAGLWEQWVSPDGEAVDSCSIVTTTANDLVREIHERMPVILPTSAYERWLDPGEVAPERLRSLIAPYPADEMDAHPVSTRVNSPKNDDARLVESQDSSV